MKKYNVYKDSGIEWIGEIPEGWRLKKLKFVAEVMPSNVDKKSDEDEQRVRLCNYLDVYRNDFITGKLNFMEATASASQIEKFSLRRGDVMVTKDSEDPNDIAIPACVKESLHDVVCGYHLTLIRSYQTEIKGNYLFWMLKSKKYNQYFSTEANGVTRYGIGTYPFKNLPTILPSTNEQTQIANYLDHKTGQIDKLITDKEKLIELLNEERTGMINQAVTKGINPEVPMKDSGIDWLGEVPEHWDVKKLKFCFKIIGGFAFKSEDFIEQGIQLIKIGNLYQNQLQLDRQPTFVPVEYKHIYSSYLAKREDILMSLTGTLGKRDYGYAILIEKDAELLINQRVAKINIMDCMAIDFSINLFHSEAFLNKLFSIPTGTKQGNLSTDDILSIQMAIPSKSEQIQIGSYIKDENNKIRVVVEKLRDEIEHLKEYKTALISEVVTGKVDVRNKVIAEQPTLA